MNKENNITIDTKPVLIDKTLLLIRAKQMKKEVDFSIDVSIDLGISLGISRIIKLIERANE